MINCTIVEFYSGKWNEKISSFPMSIVVELKRNSILKEHFVLKLKDGSEYVIKDDFEVVNERRKNKM